MNRPAHPRLVSALAALLALIAVAIASLRIAAVASPGITATALVPSRAPARADQLATCTGAITIAGGAYIVGAFAGTSISTTVDVGVQCDGERVVRVRHTRSSGDCRFPLPADIQRPWEPLVGSVFTVTLYVPGNFVGQNVTAQFQTESGAVSPVYCDDVVTEGMPPQPTVDPNATARPTRRPTPTPEPTSTPTTRPSPTPTPRLAPVSGRIVLANGAATIAGALGERLDVPLRLDLTGAGAPLCRMRLRLSGGPCRADADGGFSAEPWQPFRRLSRVEIPLARHGVTISAWAQVKNASGDVSRAFCDDVVVHAPHTATPSIATPTPRMPTPLPADTSCPHGSSPVFLPIARYDTRHDAIR